MSAYYRSLRRLKNFAFSAFIAFLLFLYVNPNAQMCHVTETLCSERVLADCIALAYISGLLIVTS